MLYEAQGYVYMITEEHVNKYVKIGFSRFGARIENTFNPRTLVVVDVFAADKVAERDLHRKLKKYQIRNEWFHYTATVKRRWIIEKRYWTETVKEVDDYFDAEAFHKRTLEKFAHLL